MFIPSSGMPLDLAKLAKSSADAVVDRPSAGENIKENDRAAKASLATNTSIANEYQRSEDASLKIITNDGDEVSLDFFSDYHRLNAQSMTTTPDMQQFSAYFEESFSVGIAVSVRGELDEGELAAITDLVNQVQSVSEKFFAGDLQGALANALTVQKDASELDSFRLDLHSLERRTAVRQYEEIQHMTDSPPSSKPVDTVSPKGKDLIDSLLRQLQALSDQLFDGLAPLDDKMRAKEDISMLMANFLSPRYDDILPNAKHIANDMFRHVMDNYPLRQNDKADD